jgi:hypothetical protein
MTTKQAMTDIDRVGLFRVGQFTIPVIILDTKEAYGTTRYLVAPTHGDGQTWTTQRPTEPI